MGFVIYNKDKIYINKIYNHKENALKEINNQKNKVTEYNSIAKIRGWEDINLNIKEIKIKRKNSIQKLMDL